MALHFTESELAARRERAVALMQKRGLDGLLMFRQESMYYLTGYDTFGYVFFQCLYLGADGRLILLTRAPDRLQAMRIEGSDGLPGSVPRWALVRWKVGSACSADTK